MHRLGTMVILSAVIVACGGDRNNQTAATTTPAQRLELGIVAIGARIGDDSVRSSGIVINADAGLVLTTAHTVWGARSLKLATQLGLLHGRIVARAPCDDLALVEAYPRIPGLLALAVAPASAPARGELLRTVGRRRADPDAGAYGLVSIPVRATDGRALPGGTTALDAPLVPEVSGGAMLDEAGRLVGMAIPRASRVGLSLPWSVIQRRLAELRPGPREVYVGWRDQYRCVSALHAYARGHHPGFHARDARLNAYVPATRLPGTEGLDG
jgi:S1-C subfamily serine protease